MCYAALMSIKLPIPKHNLIGHRGVAGLRPENTYASFSLAAEMGLTWIEFDVLLTKDDQWVVMHDDELQRTTTGHGLVRETTLATITDLEAGLWFRPPYKDQKVPTLLGTLQFTQNLNLFCNVEVKSSNRDPEKHAEIMSDFITQFYTLTSNRILVSSFDLAFLKSIRTIMPNLPLGYLVEGFTPDTLEIAKNYNFSSINCAVEKMTLGDLDAAGTKDIPVFLYTVNDKTTAQFWLKNGVQGLFTDRPDLLL